MKFDQSKIDAFKEQSGAIVTIQELLRGRDADFDAAKTVRLVRHADNRKVKIIEGRKVNGSLYEIYRNNKSQFLSYQREQKKGKLDKVDYIVSFIGVAGTRARFVGVYKVGKNFIESPFEEGCVLYDLELVDAFEPLTHRVVIEWGGGTSNIWHGYKTLKAVTRIDEGFEDEKGMPRFISYDKAILSFNDLKAIINCKEDNTWITPLQSVNCIYLITDKSNGRKYVGSTYADKGIWNRWTKYVRTKGHGDNKVLESLIKDDPDYAAKHFQWTILEILSLNICEKEAISREKLYKDKFLTREHGYNEN